jgi:hypothetical protein
VSSCSIPACFFIGRSVGIAVNEKLNQWIDTTGLIVQGAIGVLAISLNFSRLRTLLDSRVRYVTSCVR